MVHGNKETNQLLRKLSIIGTNFGVAFSSSFTGISLDPDVSIPDSYLQGYQTKIECQGYKKKIPDVFEPVNAA